MIKRIVCNSALVGLLLAACVKDRHCECKNSNGTYDAGTVKATKSAAKKRCENLSEGATKCYLK